MPRLNTAVMDVATNKVEKFAYKPWGMRRNPANWSENVVKDYTARFSRGYCMHEHLPNLGLINMGGRVYNARTNQFISPDPYRQAPDSWLNCNRFGYCMGNPVMYTDPDGEFILTTTAIAIICGAAIGGMMNCGIKTYNGQINSMGDALAAFGWGALAGAATSGMCAVAGAAAAGTAAASSVGYAMGTGALASAANTLILSMGNHFSFGDRFASIGDVLKGAALGAIAGGAMQAVSNFFAGKNVWTGQGRTPDADLAPQKALAERNPEELGSGRMTPYEKGQEGIRMAEEQIRNEGMDVVGREVTLRVEGINGKVRIDLVVKQGDKVYFIEVKNGPYARCTPNQKIIYPLMEDRIPVIPVGKNAYDSGFDIGTPMINYEFRFYKFNAE